MSTEALSTTSNTGMATLSQDIEIPRLNVIQKMSQIEGPVGSVVLDKEFVLLEAEQKTPVVIIGASKRWKEDIPYDSEQIPKVVSTQQEATLLAEESSYPIIEFAEIVLLIPQIGDDDSNFPYPIGEQNYQLGRISVQKDAYRMTYKRLFTFQTFNSNIPVASRLWNFGTELMTKGKYSWYVPTLTVTKEESPKEAQEFASRPNA
jgi:hypothetical protein